VKERQSQLQQRTIECSLLDSLVKLEVVGEESLDVVQLRDQPRELAVEGNEVGCLYLGEDEVEVLVEVGTVDLHSANYMRYAPSINSPQNITKMEK
jgi:hypothetical protein